MATVVLPHSLQSPSAPPILRFPYEITLAILLEAVAYSGPTWKWTLPLILKHVCRDWARVILMEHQLWATVDWDVLTSFPPARMRNVLLLSGNSPLKVHLSGNVFYPYPDFQHPDFQHLLESLELGLRGLADHTSRIVLFEALNMPCEAMSLIFDTFKTCPAPKLRDLRLGISTNTEKPWGPQDRAWTLFGGVMPMLQIARIHDAPGAWSSCVNMTTLDITEEMFPLGVLLQTLQYCTRLRYLRLEFIDYDYDDDRDTKIVVELPHLRRLNIQCPTPAELYFLRQLSIPLATSIELSFTTLTRVQAVTHAPDCCVTCNIASGTEELTLELRNGEFGKENVLRSPTGLLTIAYCHLYGVDDPALPEVYCGLGIFSLPALRTLTIHGHATDTFPAKEWERVFASLSSLVRLNLQNVQTLITPIKLLGFVGPADSPSVYCPKLHTLTMEFSTGDHADIVRVVKESMKTRAEQGLGLESCQFTLKMDEEIKALMSDMKCAVIINEIF
ncbi:uncharacterized protein FIBRA_02223 [Fibroporia radiculosa]|uniref:F-box domain-containing protein n=1 Tax=Fibroporia radiculosa TaxID=599839 RepID=J4GMN4_9APHY|nr:uncharacterized protein FIBRA_02223 [Fibroporia radiculosa]CCM00195.1 predicted protein [Fibroporia radiculosa]